MHAQSCPTLCDPMNCSPPGSSVQGILPARILESVAMSSSRGSSQPKDWTCIAYVSGIAGRFSTTSATCEAPYIYNWIYTYMSVSVCVCVCVCIYIYIYIFPPFGTLHPNGNIFPFLLCFLLLFFSQLLVRPPQTTILPFCISFPWGWSWSLSPVQSHEPPSIFDQVFCLSGLVP